MRTDGAPQARSRALCLAAATLGVGLLLAPHGTSAQVSIGGHLARAPVAFDGTYGVGLRAGMELPYFPRPSRLFDYIEAGMDLIASGEYFLPDCSGCGLWGLSLDANLWFQLPLVRPYATIGVVYRDVSDAYGMTDHGVGLGLGLGMDAGLAGVRAFGEGRLEIIKEGLGAVWRLGLVFDAW